MERPEALKELLAKVTAGTLPEAVFHGCHGIRGHWAYVTGLSQRQRADVFLAYNGSLDAAKALHDAVLPGWDWSGYYCGSTTTAFEYQLETEAMRQSLYFEPVSGSSNHNPSRAWLIAILKVLISQEAAP